MEPELKLWEDFLRTGKIEYYMAYCDARNKNDLDLQGGAVSPGANNYGRGSAPQPEIGGRPDFDYPYA